MRRIKEIIDKILLNEDLLCKVKEIYLLRGRRALSEYLGIRYNSVGHVIKACGLYSKKNQLIRHDNDLEVKNRCLRKFFLSGWNDSLAYVIGYIVGDGCLRNKREGFSWNINIWSKDTQILIDMAKEIGYTGSLKSGIDFSDDKIGNFLLRIGIIPNKSEKGCTVDIPKKYYGSYLLGLFDSDGCITVNGPCLKRVYFYGHPKVIDDAERMIDSFAIYHKRGRRDDKLEYLAFYKQFEIIRLRDAMYKSCHLCLKRKRDRFYGEKIVRHL